MTEAGIGIDSERLGTLVNGPLHQMLGTLYELHHPDGHLALLCDSVFGIYNDRRELTEAPRLIWHMR